jgi:hypothetical protein
MDDFKFTEYHRQYCKELLEYHKNKKKLYYLMNREEILEKQKQYRAYKFLKIKAL